MGGWMGGWMAKWMAGWVNGWMDGWEQIDLVAQKATQQGMGKPS